MRILVTGGTGLIGSNIVRKLMEDGHDVLITGHDAEQKLKGFTGKYLQPSFLGIDWDAIGHIDAVIHEAAINDTTNMDRAEMFRANADSSKALFDYVVKNGCKRIVYASSTAIYGDLTPPYQETMTPKPLNPYAESKVALDALAMQVAKDHPDVTVVGLRYCNVYGRGESHKGSRATMIYQLAHQMKQHAPRIFTDGEQKRDYIYVKDVVTANMLALAAKESCIVNCGSGVATTFNRIIEILNGVLGTQWKPDYIDNPYQGRYQDYTLCDMSLAKEKLGFVPAFSIESGIRDYYESGFLV
ncbi:MAG TPA: NAD-dependent epimerase/dehydratase family protein [Candidatus Paceibacterota bacterium]|nr:NAD-dependent epimerase/dehydratase family protein [Candidatus Paceibacterota bacterium]